MAASSNHCPVLGYLGPCTLEFRPQHLTDAVGPDKYLGVASIGMYKWKIWDQGTYVLSSRDRWQKITLCVTRLSPTPRYTGNKLHLLRHSPAVVAWGQDGHMARPGFAEPLGAAAGSSAPQSVCGFSQPRVSPFQPSGMSLALQLQLES